MDEGSKISKEISFDVILFKREVSKNDRCQTRV